MIKEFIEDEADRIEDIIHKMSVFEWFKENEKTGFRRKIIKRGKK